MHVQTHHTIEQLESMANDERDARRHLILRALILARQGWTAPRIAEALGKSPRTIEQWVGNYNRQQLQGLHDRRGGNHRYLTDDQEAQLAAYLDQGAADPEGGVRHAAELIPWIEQQFGKLYSLKGLYDLLHRLGYSWLMPRPRHPHADAQAQDDFKKTSLRASNRSRINIPTNASRSGSRTKHALASRAR